MKSHEDRAIDQFRAHLAGLLILKHALTALTAWAFLAGIAVLALRFVGVSSLTLLWGLVTLPLALVPAVILASRRLPSRSAVRAVLDRHNEGGGLVMAAEEVALGGWSKHLPTLKLPRVSWQGGRVLSLLGCGVAFLLLGLFLPQSFAEMGGGNPPLDIARPKAKLEKQIEVLKEEAVLDPKRADDLKGRLDKLHRDAQGKDPVKTLEALDHLKDLVTRAAKEAAESDARKSETLARAESLTEALKKRPKEKMSAKALAEAMAQLSALTRKAADENSKLQEKLDQELMDALKAGSLTPEQMEKLKGLLKDAKGDLADRLAKLVKAELIDGELLELADKAGEMDTEGLLAYLKEVGASDELLEGIGEEGGRGGVTRGPGPAPMMWKDPTSEDGFKFKEQALPPAKLKAIKDSKTVGLSAGVPQKGGETGSAEAGALSEAASGGGSASTQVVLPRHRGAVERYFERGK